jgi:hypothetical protein
MTRKLAVFVEGQTEQIFTKKLIAEIAGRKNVAFEERKYHAKRIINVALTDNEGNDKPSRFVLIVDCGRDEHVKSVILEQRQSLINSKYELVIGLRDLHPLSKADYPKLEMGLKTRVPTRDIPIEFVIAVMEVEAWFLQEWTHYEKIDPGLTIQNIVNAIHFNPKTDNADDVLLPADTLNQIYRLAGKSYSKARLKVERTVESLDYENIYLNVRGKLPQLNQFIEHIDNFV